MTSLSLIFACALQVLAFGPGEEVVPPERVAQLAADPRVSAAATDRARARVDGLVKRSRQLRSEHARLRKTYDKQLAENEKLKRQRPSWNRDRVLGEKLAKSQRTAKKLKQVQARQRKVSAALKEARKALFAAVSRELKGTVSGSRRVALEQLHTRLGRMLRPKTRKIFLPDERLDEYADPDELREQIKLLAEAEQALARQERELAQRARRYAHRDDLRRRNRRASEMSQLDEDRVRRSSAASGSKTATQGARDGAGGAGATADAESVEPSPDADESGSPPPQDDFNAGDGDPSPDLGSLEDNSIALADVVDASTQDELRRASRSNDPRAKAKAAKKARAQVAARLRRLAKSRKAIEAHLRRLRRK